MADITINGEVVATLTENAKDIGNSEYLKIIIGSKSYYARLATDISKLFVYKQNKKQYVQKDPILFEAFQYECNHENVNKRFGLWLPKGKYLILLTASNTKSNTINVTEGSDIVILFECNLNYMHGDAYLTITDGVKTLYSNNVKINEGEAFFKISRQGD